MNAPTHPGKPPPSGPLLGRGWPAAGAVLLVAVVLLAWQNTLHAPFIFDDRAAILDNPSLRDLGSVGEILAAPSDGRAVGGRPLVNLSLALNYCWSGTDPWSYHAVNLAIHALAGLTLLGILRRTLCWPGLRAGWAGTSRARKGNPGGSGNAPHVPQAGLSANAGTGTCPPTSRALTEAEAFALALAAAMLWALHPLQTESVTCIVQRTESLCGLFYLLALYGLARAGDTTRAGPWLALSTAACWLGMGTKEVMVSAPLILLLYDRTFLAGSFRAALRQRRAYYLALGFSWLLLLGLVLTGGGARGTAAGWHTGVSPWSYLLKQSEALVLYLKLAVWPHPLVLDYGTAVPSSLTEVGWQAIVVVALLAGTVWALVRRPVAGFFGAWFFLILAPSSSVMPLAAQTMAEHRMYLPLAALVTAAVMGIHALAGRRVLPWLFLLAAIAGALTWRRNETYRSELALWSDTAVKVPANPRAHLNFGAALLELGRASEAAAEFEWGERLQPNSSAAHSNLCLAYARLDRFDEAVVQGEAALELAPGSRDARANLAEALYGRGNRQAAAGGFTAAILAYRRAVELVPDYAVARNNLANALLVAGQTGAAIEEYRAVLRLRPGDESVQQNLQRALEIQAAH